MLIFDSRERWFPVGVDESLELHGYVWERNRMRDASSGAVIGNLDFPRDMGQPHLPPVGYHRVARGGRLYWHQFWLWYLYNPWDVAGVGRHEGDWEFVQVGCADAAGSAPILATCSQHHSGSKREFWNVETRDRRPIVYVARDSHANYFSPEGGFEDVADGHGRMLCEIEWRRFGGWADWPGRWGNSDGRGKSPESPGCQGDRWHHPHRYHSAAHG